MKRTIEWNRIEDESKSHYDRSAAAAAKQEQFTKKAEAVASSSSSLFDIITAEISIKNNSRKLRRKMREWATREMSNECQMATRNSKFDDE
jgi:hypothetical protein